MKIFRKFRQSMLKENRFGKYLLYAFGEIALVVIGILIALSIHNASDERKSKESLNKYLSEIIVSINYDLEFYNLNEGRMDEDLLDYNRLKKREFDLGEVPRMINVITKNSIKLPISNTYTTLIELGKMNEIEDSKLISLIHTYYNKNCTEYNLWVDYHQTMVWNEIESTVLHELKYTSNGELDLENTLNELKSGKYDRFIGFQIIATDGVGFQLSISKKNALKLRDNLQAYIDHQTK